MLEALREWGAFEIAVTRAGEQRPAQQLARDAVAAGVQRIVVLGGDGTASQALNGIYAAGGRDALASVAFAVIPAGTGRDFARTAGLPRKPETAARRIARDGTTQRVDVGSVVLADGSEHLYLNVASFGVSARIAHALEAFPELKRRAGALAFGLATVRAGLGYSPDLVDLRVDDGEVQGGAVAAAAMANGAYFGGGMHVAPTARLDDGLLEVIRFGDLARSDFVLSLPRLYRGTHYSHPKVRVAQGRTVVARPAGGPSARRIEIEADGEVIGALPATFSVYPAALALVRGNR